MFRLPSFSIECLREQNEALNKKEDRCLYCNMNNSNNGNHLVSQCTALPDELKEELNEIKKSVPEAAIFLEDEELFKAKIGKDGIQKVLLWMKRVLVESAKRATTAISTNNEVLQIGDQVTRSDRCRKTDCQRKENNRV
eukprot:GHVP01001823.1.p1 GENE.GHVP01001823.1~~GHVP01001823.1.p1  ORF type:complete len:139 (+),score=25.76 GHVP01001823.1:122-538(+)